MVCEHQTPSKSTNKTTMISLDAADSSPLTPQDTEKSAKASDALLHMLQSQINAKLEWKNRYRNLKDSMRKGARVEVACSDPALFESLFEGAMIKKGKDGKLSTMVKTEEEWIKVKKLSPKLNGRKYRYNASFIEAPISASLKDCSLTFSFKFGIC